MTRKRIKNLFIFFRTLNDIGFKRIFLRIFFEVQKFIESKLSSKILAGYTKYSGKIPEWKKNKKLNFFSEIKLHKNFDFKNKIVEFKFLNEIKKLKIPFIWNNSSWSRLWQFNLHYFDWGKFWIEEVIDNKGDIKNLYLLDYLIDEWIKKNNFGKGDGWNSYTSSLRIRNWVLIFRIFPEFVTDERLKSLWLQICWLNCHKEYCYGGNHLIENLTSLIIGALQFKGKEALFIYKDTLRKLEKEINRQILDDGGHEERTASYHLLLLDRLVECGFYIQLNFGYSPKWMIEVIKRMTEWAFKISLKSNTFPRFNDSSLDEYYSLFGIKNYALSFIKQKNNLNKGIRSIIYETVQKNNPLIVDNRVQFSQEFIDKELVDLPDTGWTIIKLGGEWEFLFKCGTPCPNHLPAHCHSDLLSFELYYEGKPVFSEFGTSVYGNSELRQIERSAFAHNSFQLSYPLNPFSNNSISWIEPVEVWDVFRAGRKANTINRIIDKDKSGNFIVQGSHDGFQRFGAKHLRQIYLKLNSENNLQFSLIDEISCSKKMAWRQCWHLGPNINPLILKAIIKKFKSENNFNYEMKETWHASNFGKRIPRKSLIINGFINPGRYSYKVDLLMKKF